MRIFALVVLLSSGPAWAGDRTLDAARGEAMRHYSDQDYAGFVVRMEAVAATSRSDVDLYNLACGYALSGRGDQAMGVLQALIARGATFDLGDSDLDALRSRPDFVELVGLATYLEAVDQKLEPVRDRAFDQYQAGRYDLFVDIMERVASYSRTDRDVYNLACGYALAGRPEEALAQLQILAARNALDEAGQDSDFDSLRADPRFQALLAR